MPTPSTDRRLFRFDALGVFDGEGVRHSPGSILIETGGVGPPARIIAVGRAADVARHEAARSPSVQIAARPRSILIPGLVNAHTHLDLTHIGPRPHDPGQGFVPWIDMIRRERRTEAEGIADSVRRGIELSRLAGVVAVGDIAGAALGQPNLTPWRTLRSSALAGGSYLEFFGIGTTWERSAAAVEKALAEAWREHPRSQGQEPVRLGLQPHAPNTVSSRLYRHATELARRDGLPLATHLSESPEELEFVARARGPQRELLERLGIWDDSIPRDVGQGRSPVEHLRPVLERGSFTVAHVNSADDDGIRTLARNGACVAFCPRASAYFGAERSFGPHRYRDMMKAGVVVALGTDSIVNLPNGTDAPGGPGIGVLEEMRFLHRRDGTAPDLLLRMGTTNGARALGLDERTFRFEPGGPLAGLVAVQVIQGDPVPEAVDEHALGGILMSAAGGSVELLLG